MATKRSEQEWRELINNFERYGYQNPAVFYLANDVYARDLQQKQLDNIHVIANCYTILLTKLISIYLENIG